MAKCPNCKENVSDSEQFCPKCGQLVKSVNHVKEYVNTKKEVSKAKVEEKKNNKIKDIFINLKARISKKVDAKKLIEVLRKAKPYIKRLLHPLKMLTPALEYSAKHKYIFFIIIFAVLSSGSYLANHFLSSESKAHKVDFARPIQPIPANGIISDYSNEIKRNSLKIAAQKNMKTYYLIKIIDIDKNTTSATAFLYSGETLKIGLPTGVYEVRYASGTNWYGMEHLFGPETYYGKVVEKIDLSFPDDYPYSIEMYGNYGGNVRTDQIKSDEF